MSTVWCNHVQSLGHQSHVAVSRPRSKGPIFHVFQPVKFQWQWTCTRPHSELITAYSLILYHIMTCLSMARRHSDFSVRVSNTSFSALWNILKPTVFSRHRIVVRRQMNRTQTPGASSFINAVSTGARTSLVKIMQCGRLKTIDMEMKNDQECPASRISMW